MLNKGGSTEQRLNVLERQMVTVSNCLVEFVALLNPDTHVSTLEEPLSCVENKEEEVSEPQLNKPIQALAQNNSLH